MRTVYSPDSWQVIKVTLKSPSNPVHYRILAGWSGSYMYGESWKLSSGCERVIDQGSTWKVPQSSGSVYMLSKTAERPSRATMGVLESLQVSNTETTLEVVDFSSILGKFGIF